MPLFSRSPKDEPVAEPQGRRIPKQSERVEANKRPLVPADRKEARRKASDQMRAQREKARLGFERGEERYLPARDKGPVRRFVRDFVDARLSIGTLAMPMMILVLILTFIQDQQWRMIATIVLWSFVAVVVLDCVFMGWQLRRAIRAKFGEGETKGHTWYASMRAVQLPFMRMPKPQTKLGHYPS